LNEDKIRLSLQRHRSSVFGLLIITNFKATSLKVVIGSVRVLPWRTSPYQSLYSLRYYLKKVTKKCRPNPVKHVGNSSAFFQEVSLWEGTGKSCRWNIRCNNTVKSIKLPIISSLQRRKHYVKLVTKLKSKTALVKIAFVYPLLSGPIPQYQPFLQNNW